jgi:single-strand DNA-binding protein
LNRVILTGRLATDPELRYTQTGRARARFNIAVNQQYRDQEGNLQETTTFIPIVVWGAQAESCANFLKKGRMVAVDGRLRIDTFETQEGRAEEDRRGHCSTGRVPRRAGRGRSAPRGEALRGARDR